MSLHIPSRANASFRRYMYSTARKTVMNWLLPPGCFSKKWLQHLPPPHLPYLITCHVSQ